MKAKINKLNIGDNSEAKVRKLSTQKYMSKSCVIMKGKL